MQLKDYIPKLGKKYSDTSFSGISFNSSKIKKIIFFLQLKEINLMVIIILTQLLKKVQK